MTHNRRSRHSYLLVSLLLLASASTTRAQLFGQDPAAESDLEVIIIPPPGGVVVIEIPKTWCEAPPETGSWADDEYYLGLLKEPRSTFRCIAEGTREQKEWLAANPIPPGQDPGNEVRYQRAVMAEQIGWIERGMKGLSSSLCFPSMNPRWSACQKVVGAREGVVQSWRRLLAARKALDELAGAGR